MIGIEWEIYEHMFVRYFIAKKISNKLFHIIINPILPQFILIIYNEEIN